MDMLRFLALFEAAVNRRSALRALNTPCRVVDGVGDGLPGLTATSLSDVLVLHAYPGRDGLETDFFETASRRCAELVGARSVVVWLHDRYNNSPGGALLVGDAPAEVTVEEHGVRYITRPLEQRNAGFFVDMREVRRFLLDNAAGLRVLNTFCFTGSLGTAALRGGAQHVVQNDISRRALTWAKENCVLQEPHDTAVRFIHEDSRTFLSREARRIAGGHSPYDLVIVDPPSFGHSKGKPFTLKDELRSLVEQSVRVLAADGILLLTSNTRELRSEDLADALMRGATSCGRTVRHLLRLAPPADDFPTSPLHSDAMRGVRARLS